MCSSPNKVKQSGSPPIRSRTGHSMLFNINDRCLYIFGGQRKRDEYLNDFFRYHVDTGEIFFLSGGLSGRVGNGLFWNVSEQND